MTNTLEPPSGEATEAPMTVAISGSTGLIGSALVESLRSDGHRVRRLVRSQTGTRSQHVTWNPATGTLDPQALADVDAVVNLAGENIGERWSREKKRKIRDSRVKGTRLLASTLGRLSPPPRVMLSASGVGVYGDRGDELLDEESPAGQGDFMAEVGREWEAATEPAEQAGVRVVKTRFGVVLSPKGGALPRMLTPFRFGVGGRIGSGKQWMSWIALPDLVSALRFAIRNTALEGAVNVTSPNPVTNADFAATLGEVLRRPALIPVPAPALRLVYGEMAEVTLLASQRMYPGRLLAAGFSFRYPELADALRAVLDR
jgi:uncharacterized protein